MFPSLGLCLAAVAGGSITTYAYEDDAPLAWRVAAGAVSGMALLGLLVLGISSLRGLNGPTLAAAAAVTSLPVLLLTNPRVRAQVRLDVREARDRIHEFGSRHVGRSLLVGVLVLVGWRALDRVLLDLPQGMYTGYANNLGDLPFHTGVIARFAFGDNFPPEHPSYAGAAFTYSYIADLVAAAFVRSGATLRHALLLQNALLLASVLVLLTAWFRELTRDRATAVLACGLAFLSGGLGWWMLARELAESAEPAKLLLNLPHDYTVMTGSSWRWGNLVTALLVPQRSLLLGLPLAALIFTLLVRVWDALPDPTGRTSRRIVAAAVLAGLLPLVHAHTYVVVLGVAACQALLYRRHWRTWWPFFALAAVLGGPQALWLAMSGSVESARFLGWHVGWDRGNSNVVAFWLRNTGLFIPLLLTALLWRDASTPVPSRLVRLYVPFVLCFIVPNVLRLAPWVWDNIKFLVYWHIASAPLVALVLVHLWRRSAPAGAAAVLLTVSLVLAGSLDIWRAMSSARTYQLFTSEGIAFARLVREIVPSHATIVHGPVYNHAVFLSGRRSLMGYPAHVWSHGLPPGAREADIRSIYKGGPETLSLLERHHVDYVVIGPFERKQLTPNEAFFERFRRVGEIGAYHLYLTSRQSVHGSADH